jgi:hypothetical protein
MIAHHGVAMTQGFIETCPQLFCVWRLVEVIFIVLIFTACQNNVMFLYIVQNIV